MKNILFLYFLLSIFLLSCDRTSKTAKEAINKTGEVVGKGASEFVHGVSEGVDETFQCTINLNTHLADNGIGYGKFKITGDSTLTIYIIFNNNFNDKITAKLFDVKGQEYGRSTIKVEGKKGEAKYFDFPFDPHTHIENRSNFVLE